jgi:acyl-CoA reductase-like NAD-dependent aldehyde dehydrogenase
LKDLEELAQLESLDNGKPIAVARAADVPRSSQVLAGHPCHFSANGPKIQGSVD